MTDRTIDLAPLMETELAPAVAQLRAVPVQLAPGEPSALLLVHSACAEDDPYHEMFFFPTDTLKLTLVAPDGTRLWQRDLGPGVVPGLWFCPVFPFDLDGAGTDAIYFVNNTDPEHPLGVSHYCLERLDARTGETAARWPWPHRNTNQSPSHMFRNFILGGTVAGEPVLVTAQGTYGDMFLQGWSAGMAPRWDVTVRASDPGARGSHMCAVADFGDDGRQQFLWGERCIEFDTGRERFCADRDSYCGHSDVAMPVLDRENGRWFTYTCREGDADAAPRVALFDAHGERVWGAVDTGHMDMGWAARIGEGGRPVAMAIRIGHKTAGPRGFFREGVDEFVFDALTGEPLTLPFSVYGTIPVDLDGDGCHELVRARSGTTAAGEVLDRHGRVHGRVEGRVVMASRFWDHPGEQIVAYTPDGVVRVLADSNAQDSPQARARHEHPLYAANRRLSATGYNLHALCGI